MSEPFRWNPLPFNFINEPGRLAEFLHFHKDLALRKECLRLLIKGWFLMNCASEKNRMSEDNWAKLMEHISRSEYLSADIRALLVKGHDSPLQRFYKICIDSFAQLCGKTLRGTIGKANDELNAFEKELKSPQNRYVGYQLPRQLPGESKYFQLHLTLLTLLRYPKSGS